jgi:hypothetical protein
MLQIFISHKRLKGPKHDIFVLGIFLGIKLSEKRDKKWVLKCFLYS